MRNPAVRVAVFSVMCLALGAAGHVTAQTGRHHGAIYTPDELKWAAGPPSLPKGAEFAVIEGDPSKKGEYFAMRLRLPDGYRIPPHWHPVHERVTVISGTFHLGQGDSFEEEGTQALEAGSYFTMAPEMRHFAWTEGTTVVQLTSIGPWQIHYVDPKDDPRKEASGR